MQTTRLWFVAGLATASILTLAGVYFLANDSKDPAQAVLPSEQTSERFGEIQPLPETSTRPTSPSDPSNDAPDNWVQSLPLVPNPKGIVHSLPERIFFEDLAELMPLLEESPTRPHEQQGTSSDAKRPSATTQKALQKIRAFRGGMFPPALSSSSNTDFPQKFLSEQKELLAWGKAFLKAVKNIQVALNAVPLDEPRRQILMGKYQDSAEALGEAILREYEKADRSRRSALFEMLLTIPNMSLPALLRGLRQPNWEVRRVVVIALASLKTTDERRRLGLLLARHDENQWVRLNAAKALSKCMPSNADLETILIHTLKDESALVRKVCVDILGDSFLESKRSRSALVAALKDEDDLVCAAALEALGSIREPEEALILKLGEAAIEGSLKVRCEALSILKIMGPKASAALPMVNTALQAEDDEVQMAAEAALDAISGQE